MIFSKLWRAIAAQMNKVANFFWAADPIAQMQYEHDLALAQIREGKEGLAQYRALVERVQRMVTADQAVVANLESKIKAYLKIGDREGAARLALELQKAKGLLGEHAGQLELHEKAYGNNLTKIKHATHKLGEIQVKIKKYDADLKMSKAEAELAELAGTLDVNVTTDFGQIEQALQDRIDRNRGRARVAADLSSEGIAEIEHEESTQKELANQALRDFEIEAGLVTPETAPPAQTTKELGPARIREEA